MRFGCDSDTDSNRAMPMARETSKNTSLAKQRPVFLPLLPVSKGPKIEIIKSRLKLNSISLEFFKPDLQNSPQRIGDCWVARLKFSISLENFNPGGGGGRS